MSNLEPQKSAKVMLDICWEPDRFPIDPVNIAKQLDIKVRKTELPPEVSGAIVKRKGEDTIIYLHVGDSDYRKRFSCAHELGHYVQRIGEESYQWVDLRKNTLSSEQINEKEIFANQFAANLLMPEDEVKKKSKQSKIELTTYFGVSGEAMKWRLKNLNIKHKDFAD